MPINKQLAVSLIDDPEEAMRTEMNEEKLEELIEDIRANGLTNPIAIVQVGQRYNVIAGHRRLVAHRRMARELIDVRDYTGESVDLDAIKFGENFSREDVSDADAAVWLAELVDKKGFNSERLMSMTKKSEAWINSRLALFRGDEQVFHALRNGKINLGTATELNMFPDDYRAMYLDICINTTPPIFLVKDWRAKLKLQMQAQPEQQQPTAGGESPLLTLGVVIECCEICNSGDLGHMMQFYRIHQHCMRMIREAIAQQAKG